MKKQHHSAQVGATTPQKGQVQLREAGPEVKRINIFGVLNVPHYICIHLLGEQHSDNHRMLVGVIVMIGGVMLSKVGVHSASIILHYGSDVVGYAIHGIGAIPFVEKAIKSAKG